MGLFMFREENNGVLCIGRETERRIFNIIHLIEEDGVCVGRGSLELKAICGRSLLSNALCLKCGQYLEYL